MTELKIGDKVAVDLDMPQSSWHKAEGYVIAERATPGYAKVRITKPGKDGHFPNVGLETTLVNLTKLPQTNTEFKVGDWVQIKGYSRIGTAFEGRIGKVVDTYDETGTHVKVKFEDSKAYPDGTFTVRYIVPAEAPKPAFKVGDFVTFDDSNHEHWRGGRGRIVDIGTLCHVDLLEAPSKNSPYKAGNRVVVYASELKLLKGNPFRVGDSVKTEGYNSEIWNNRPGVIDRLHHGKTSIVKFTDGKYPASGGFDPEYLVPRKPDVKTVEKPKSATESLFAKGGFIKAEAVDGPAHYGGKDNTYEVIKVAEAWGFQDNAYLFNALKYLGRCEHKGQKVEDLKKLKFYVDREIALEEASGN